MDFGGLKLFKNWADSMFDHTLVIAQDDPMLSVFKDLANVVSMGSANPESTVPHQRGAVCDLRIVEGVGCEMFAKLCYDEMARILEELKQGSSGRYPVNAGVRLVSAEVFEHGANSAIYAG
jgi:6-pyruvoyltetrahydropterin/6-carboxytetrahydropterin synthase